jgi:Flp pilus assembly protein TadG
MRKLLRKRQRGAAMVEFTVMLPVFLLLILGVTEIGRLIIRYNALTKSVHDGARYAASLALLGTTQQVVISGQLQTEVRNVVVYGNAAGGATPILQGLAPGQVTLTNSGPGQINVSATYPYQALLGPTLLNFGLGSSTTMSFNMQASVTMRAL